ncbi:MAG: ABC transporter substrate-binding protein [Candidatus Nanopelagicales bacterium]|nr:ABC transporter substrate-binding protein [Candidatus Nanopelagicales bacterium]
MSRKFTSRGAVAVTGGLTSALVLALAVNSAGAAPTPAPTSKANANAACAPSEGITPSTITLGFFSPKTGPAAANFAGGEAAARLRVAQENAKGGVNGRKIVLIGYDDQANGQTQTTMATKALQSDKVFGIIMTSATDSAFPTFKTNNVPVTGFNVLAMANDRNTFSVVGPTAPTIISTAPLERLKQAGVANVALISHNSPSAAAGMTNTSKSIPASGTGLNQALLITDEAQGAHDATSTALRIKNSGADGAYMSMFVDGVVSIAQALKQQGVSLKGSMGAGLVDPAVIAKAAGPLEGMIGTTYGTIPAGVPGAAGMRTYINGMKAAGLNPYGATAPVAFAAADLMIHGLKLAGKCPTRASFVDNLRKVTSYNAAGMMPQTVSFQPGVTPMGNPNRCSWFVVIKNGVPVPDPKATCGKLVDTTTGKVVLG